MISVGFVVFAFLHECAHGFGASLDGLHVSTGCNRIGDAGKKPNDPDFRSQRNHQSAVDTGSFLGPALNWIASISFVVWLSKRRVGNVATLLIGSAAVTNAWARLLPMLVFFLSAFSGHVVLEDEVTWGLWGMKPAMQLDAFRRAAKWDPVMFLSNLEFLVWPLVSLAISLTCLILGYQCLFQLFKGQLRTRMAKGAFMGMPLIVGAPMIVVLNLLDNLVRIDW
jgi:hypothetical protein